METVYTKMELDISDVFEHELPDDDNEIEDTEEVETDEPKPKKKSIINLKEKLQLLHDVENGMTLTEVSERYKIGRTTAYKVVKDKPMLLKMMQANPTNLAMTKMRQPTYQSLDEAMALYVQQCQANDIDFNGQTMLEKANQFAKALGYTEFRGSSGWLSNFKKRHGFLNRRNVDARDSQDAMTKFWREQVFTPILQKYPAKDIFFTDETGFFFNAQPGNSMTLKHEKCTEGAHSSTRVTLLLSCNMDGSEKLKPLVVGKFGRPRCFKSILTENLPVYYEFNAEAWMTAFNFERWLLHMEEYFQNVDRKVLMFVNAYPVHSKRLQKQLSHIQLEFIPPNIKTTLQPMRMHIFRAVKLFYRNALIKERLLALADNTEPYEKPTILDAIRQVAKVWECDMTAELITHFFQKSGFTTCYSNIFIDDCHEDKKNVLLTVETEMASNFGKLQSTDEGAARDTWQHYVDADKSASICAILTDEDILALVGQPQDDKGQDSDEDRPCSSGKKFKSLSVPEMKAAILKVHRSLERAPGVPTDVFQCLNKVDHYLDSIMPK